MSRPQRTQHRCHKCGQRFAEPQRNSRGHVMCEDCTDTEDQQR